MPETPNDVELAHVFDIQSGPTLEEAAVQMTQVMSRHMAEGYLPVSVSHAFGPLEDGGSGWSILVFYRRERWTDTAPTGEGH